MPSRPPHARPRPLRQTTVTTIGFFLWECGLVIHICGFFFAFYFYGKHLKNELNRNQQMQRGGLAAADAQGNDSKQKVAQSAEAANINKFLTQLTKYFIFNFFTFVLYAACPFDGPMVHFLFYTFWKVMLVLTLMCVFRCIRVPTTSAAQWVATFTCCGSKSQEAVAAQLGAVENGLASIQQTSMRRIDSVKTGTQAFFRQGSKLNKPVRVDVRGGGEGGGGWTGWRRRRGGAAARGGGAAVVSGCGSAGAARRPARCEARLSACPGQRRRV